MTKQTNENDSAAEEEKKGEPACEQMENNASTSGAQDHSGQPQS